MAFQQVDAEVQHGLVDGRNRLRQTEVRRVDELQYFGGDRRVAIDDVGDIGQPDFRSRDGLGQLQVDGRRGRQLVHPSDDGPQGAVLEARLQVAHACDLHSQGLAVAGLAQELLRDRERPADALTVCLGRERHACDLRVAVPYGLEQRDPVHAGHPHVGDDQVVRRQVEGGERCLPLCRDRDVPVDLGGELPPHNLQNGRVVVDDENASLAHGLVATD
jgi:hypothetical protein